MLRRIADALGQSVEGMFPSNGDIGNGVYPSAAEANALIAAFVKVRSAQARRRIISAAEAEARAADIA